MNQILNCADELFDKVIDFKTKTQNYPSWDDFRNEIKWGFLNFEFEAAKCKISNFILQEAKYALVAYIDEVVLTSDWVQRDEWAKETLQLEFFKEHNAGERFFERLNNFRQGGEVNLELLEIYFLCLQLGYKGKYQRLGEEKWQALQSDLRNQIDNHRGSCSTVVLPKIINKGICDQTRNSFISSWGIIFTSFIIIFGLYIAEYWTVL